LPYNLSALDCWSNHITELPELPLNLTFFDCSYNHIINIDDYDLINIKNKCAFMDISNQTENNFVISLYLPMIII
jgi:Leucine-rich repeat (LRR) protein